MSNVRNPRAKWVLPTNVHPKTHTDWCVPVPDDPFYRAAFLGALQNLGAAYLWQDDAAHTAKQVARVWRDIIDQLQNCPKSVPRHGTDVEEFMPLRVDCDCNVFVTCCDGTEKQIYTSDQVKALLAGQVVEGAPQPTPGKCQSFPLTLVNGGQIIAPTPVSTGDTVALSAITGASQGTSTLDWRCANGGGTFFAGICGSSIAFDAAALVPGTPVGQIVMKLGSTWYAVESGTFTVPGGVSLQEPIFALNYNPAHTVFGTITFTATICNNQALTTRWTHVFDFKVDPGPFLPAIRAAFPTIPLANWVSGTGWQSVYNADGSSHYNEMRMYITGLPSTAYDTVSDIWTDTVNIDENALGPGSNTTFTVKFNLTPLTAGTNVHSAATATSYSDTSVRLDVVDLSSGVSHTITVSGLTLSGVGVDPF